MIKTILFAFLVLSASAISADPLNQAVDNNDRKANNITRDIYRNPYETISFFRIEPDMRVIELSPGSGWYTEILSAYLEESGLLIAAHFNPNTKSQFLKKSRANFEKMLKEDDNFKKVKLVNLDSSLAPSSSVDAVLTFRNLHNWLGPTMEEIFKNSFNALKPGGFFGIVEHRAKPGATLKEMKDSGYVTEAHAIQAAERTGFKFVAKSDVNANPKDTTNHPKGVWTLPPTLRLKEVDKSKYLSIGESDRMTLLFIKPESS